MEFLGVANGMIYMSTEKQEPEECFRDLFKSDWEIWVDKPVLPEDKTK